MRTHYGFFGSKWCPSDVNISPTRTRKKSEIWAFFKSEIVQNTDFKPTDLVGVLILHFLLFLKTAFFCAWLVLTNSDIRFASERQSCIFCLLVTIINKQSVTIINKLLALIINNKLVTTNYSDLFIS